MSDEKLGERPPVQVESVTIYNASKQAHLHVDCVLDLEGVKRLEAENAALHAEVERLREQSKIDSLIAGKAMSGEVALQQRAEKAEQEVERLKAETAFPAPFPEAHSQGMSLRDWFAGQALAGGIPMAQREDETAERPAMWAYELADAMIAERMKLCEESAVTRAETAERKRDQWRECAGKLAERVHHVVDDNDGMPEYDADWAALDEFDRLEKEASS
jgi:hypothetical protein